MKEMKVDYITEYMRNQAKGNLEDCLTPVDLTEIYNRFCIENNVAKQSPSLIPTYS